MNKLKLALGAAVVLATATLIAQSDLNPAQADWRMRLRWDDPNEPGAVARWIVCASNTVSLRTVSTTNLYMDYDVLMQGLPNGNYAIFNLALSATSGELSDPSTNHFIHWVGKIKPGIGLRTGK